MASQAEDRVGRSMPENPLGFWRVRRPVGQGDSGAGSGLGLAG